MGARGVGGGLRGHQSGPPRGRAGGVSPLGRPRRRPRGGGGAGRLPQLALVCGNAVVFKPAEDTPLLAHTLLEILLEAGLPRGVLNLVHGYGEEAGAALVRHPGVDLISFTGSSETGREVAKVAAETYK